MSEDITKLPKWAQKRVEQAERDRDDARKALRDYEDSATESPIFTEDWIHSGKFEVNRRYIQDRAVYVEWNGVRLEVRCPDDRPIELRFESLNRCVGDVVIAPRAANMIWLLNRSVLTGDDQKG